MNRKSDKVEEPTVPYVTKKVDTTSAAQNPNVKKGDEAAFAKVTAKIFSERKELLRKLAQ